MNCIEVTGPGEVQVGRSTYVDASVQAVFSQPGRIVIGDYCHIGPGVKFVCSGGDVHIGDWTSLHDRCLVLSSQGVDIGEHCWFGQHCVIDGTGGLSIGRGVRVGMYSQLWSHVAAGEQIEGCTLFGERPVKIEDDVWLVGSCVVASGVTLGKRCVALINSNITKSWPEQTVLVGSPAAPKPSLSFYRDVTLAEKWSMLQTWLHEASEQFDLVLTSSGDHELTVCLLNQPDAMTFVRDAAAARDARCRFPGRAVCCVEDKTYNKQLNETERRVLKFLAGNKARFYALA